MANEAKIMAAFDAAKAQAPKMGAGTYTLDEILKGNADWDSLPWQNKGAVGERFRTAVKKGEVAGVKLGGDNEETGDREYIVD
ncbi:MAG: hypothetical protein HDQ87_04245 [Clostridia bacterium]|nr:hypothetical protein [Clostridia bacterium]